MRERDALHDRIDEILLKIQRKSLVRFKKGGNYGMNNLAIWATESEDVDAKMGIERDDRSFKIAMAMRFAFAL